MPNRPDYYQLLGLTPEASTEEIQGAYDQEVRQWHPDVNNSPDATERTAELNAARETLTNAATRAEYDRQWQQRHRTGAGRPRSAPRRAPASSTARQGDGRGRYGEGERVKHVALHAGVPTSSGFGVGTVVESRTPTMHEYVTVLFDDALVGERVIVGSFAGLSGAVD